MILNVVIAKNRKDIDKGMIVKNLLSFIEYKVERLGFPNISYVNVSNGESQSAEFF